MALCGCAEQPEAKFYTIGVINFSPAAEPAYDGFRQGMAELGYREGHEVRYLYRGHLADKKELAAEAKRLAAMKIDLIYAMSTPASLAAKEATAHIGTPVVFGPVSSPLASGLVADLKHPGGNITGVTFFQQEPKRLELLKTLKPSIQRVCFPHNPKDPSPVLNLARLQEISQKLQVELVPIPLHDHQEIDQFLSRFPQGFDAIYLPTDSLMASRAADFAALAIARQLPLSPAQREGVEAGGLVSFGFSTFAIGHQVARLADQILQGIAPADLPVEMPEFEISVNLATAQKIKLIIPDSILRQAVVIRE